MLKLIKQRMPRGVHFVVSRGRLYIYFQQGRGTEHAGPRTRLPDDPHTPQFMKRVRELQGIVNVQAHTFAALVQEFETYLDSKACRKSPGTVRVYKINLAHAVEAWGDLDPKSLRPKHTAALHDTHADEPGKADNIVGALSSLTKWGLLNGKLDVSLTTGVEKYGTQSGHRPWTPEQCAKKFEIGKPGSDHRAIMVRRGLFLLEGTGQRISDVTKMGWQHLQRSPNGRPGFDLGWRGQTKTGVRPWCPMWAELEMEMATWPEKAGLFLFQSNGKPYSEGLFRDHFMEFGRDVFPELATVSIHGLRGTCIVRLKRRGISGDVISDIVGLSLAMVQRYTRFEDKQTTAEDAIGHLLDADRASRTRGGRSKANLVAVKRLEK
jgi:integrase